MCFRKFYVFIIDMLIIIYINSNVIDLYNAYPFLIIIYTCNNYAYTNNRF